MKKKAFGTDTVTCPNEECEADIDVSYTPATRGRTYGPPEDCYPPDPDELDAPSECPHCGYAFTDEDAERWMNKLAEDYTERASEGRHRYGRGGF